MTKQYEHYFKITSSADLSFPMAKMHNGGNSFIVKLTDHFTIKKEYVRFLCHPHFGLNADGLILIKYKNGRWNLAFFNNDGTRFKMCFNGTFCAAYYLKSCLKQLDVINLWTSYVGEIKATFKKEVILDFPIKHTHFKEQIVKGFSVKGKFFFLAIADNHLVVFTEKNYFKHPLFLKYARELRKRGDLFPKGTNVHFAYIKGKTVFIRHYEKGIENETLSCGSGCIAVGLVLNKNRNLIFKTPGGIIELFKVEKERWKLKSTPKMVSFLSSVIPNIYDKEIKSYKQ